MVRIKALVAALAVAVSTIVVGGAAPAPAGATVNPTPSFDPFNRTQVWNAYLTSLAEPRTVPTGWTGNTSTCTQGTESAASQQATLAAINFYRELNNLPAITLDSTMNTQALGAAFLMQANGALNHYPPNSWSCWNQARYDAAGSSNLSQGAVGAGSIDIYMADPGAGNYFAGHRRYVLHPRATKLGVGSTSGFAALRTGSEYWGARPAGVEWISWPNPGFVPQAALRPFSWLSGDLLFSLSSNTNPDANYADATITVKVGATNLTVTKNPQVNLYGDNTLTFYVTPPASFDSSGADVKFDITVSGAKTAGGAAIAAYSWSSTSITSGTAAATVPGAPTNVVATASNASALVDWDAPANTGGSAITGYKVTPYIGGVAQAARTFAGNTTTVQAIGGLTNGQSYTFRVQAINAIGTGALSAPSNTVTPTAPGATVPAAPTNVQATAGESSATVRWTAPANGGAAITGYEITPSKAGVPQPVVSFSGTPTSWVVPGLTNGSAYTFKVQAVNAVGTGAASAASNSVTPALAEFRPWSGYPDMVQGIFLGMVGRQPTDAEKSQWVATISGSGTSGDLAAFLRGSSTHTSVVDPVARLYWAFFERIPDRSGLEYWIAQRKGGKSLKAIADFFAKSNEFKVKYGTLTNAQFVNQVYLSVLGRPADSGGSTYWTGELDAGRRSRGAVMLGFSESPEYKAKKDKEVTVALLYIQMLRRSPTTAELANGVTAITNTSVAAYATVLLRSADPH